MTYDDALLALLGMFGRRVLVRATAGAQGEPRVTVALLDGILSHTLNRGAAVIPDPAMGKPEWRDDDAQFFVIGDSRDNGFYLSPHAFSDARWLDEEQTNLWIEHGPDVVLTIAAVGPAQR